MDNIFAFLLLAALVACFIFAIGFLVKWITKKPKKKWGIVALTAFVAFWVIGIVWGVVSPSDSEKVDGGKSETAQTETAPPEPPDTIETADEIVGETVDELIPEITAETNPFVEKLVSFGFTEEEATENAKILIQCGIPTISVCEPTDPNATVDGLVSYRGKLDDDRMIWFTVENRKIFYVSLNGEDLYDEENGGFLKNFDEVHIPETSISVTVSDELRNKTESVLDGYFASSRYYDAWGFAREDNQYMVQCQATDGSMLTSNWINCRVWYEQQDRGDFVVTGVQINGKQYKLK